MGATTAPYKIIEEPEPDWTWFTPAKEPEQEPAQPAEKPVGVPA